MLNMFFKVKEFMVYLFSRFFSNRKHYRKEIREAFSIKVPYYSIENQSVEGVATLRNLSKGGFCISLEGQEPKGSIKSIALRLNPHAFKRYINIQKIQRDNFGSFLANVKWVQEKELGGSFQSAF